MQDCECQAGRLRICRMQWTLRQQHARHIMRRDAMVANPGFPIVFDGLGGNAAERALPRVAIVRGIADDQVRREGQRALWP